MSLSEKIKHKQSRKKRELEYKRNQEQQLFDRANLQLGRVRSFVKQEFKGLTENGIRIAFPHKENIFARLTCGESFFEVHIRYENHKVKMSDESDPQPYHTIVVKFLKLPYDTKNTHECSISIFMDLEDDEVKEEIRERLARIIDIGLLS